MPPCRSLSRRHVVPCLVLLAWSLGASARMYQWVDTQPGTVQLSGAPPSWYRAGVDGPRVFVFENGRLVDDTGRNVPAEEAAALRAAAFGAAVPAAPVLEAPLFDAPAAPDEAAAVPPVEDSTSRQIVEFKALLDAYDRAQESNARETLEAP